MAVRERSQTLLSSLSNLFYISKIFGIVPHSFLEFYNKKLLKVSVIGNLWSLLCIAGFVAQYHIVTVKFSFSDTKAESSTLTTAIGLFISYMSPVMMFIDIILGVANRKGMIALINKYDNIDERLAKENIYIKNEILKFRANVLIIIVVCGEMTLVILNNFQFNFTENFQFLWCFGNGLPILVNTLEKIWFVSLVYALKQRFHGVNTYLDGTVKSYLEKNKITDIMTETDTWDLGYLHKEITLKKKATDVMQTHKFSSKLKKSPKIISVVPWDQSSPVKTFGQEKDKTSHIKEKSQGELTDVMKLEVKLNTICQIHDEICEVGKILNRMWSLQMLSLMAYGFMSITAQFYFLYCYLVGQTIPALFQSAESTSISAFFIAYTSAKCVYVIFLSWQTKMESRKTGVCLHRISNTVDKNDFYEISNHLSLKLLNHCVNFTACGFFNLDMTTIYAVTGAITSYLIILIQFNLAAHRPLIEATKSIEALTTPISAPQE